MSSKVGVRRLGRSALLIAAALLIVSIFSLVVQSQPLGTLFVQSDRVGIGTDTPSDLLHVSRSDGTTKVLVDENSATVTKRFMFELENNGAPGFIFTNSASGDTWQFAQTAVGDFTVSLIGTGGSELQVNKDGRVTMGPGATQTFNLAPNGNLTINGTLTQGSSRDIKENFSRIEPQEILARVTKLPLQEWTYKADAPESRHLGPVAEDFRAAFGLGEDDKHIAPMDAAGVALASIQAMHGLMEDKDQRIADLEEQNLALEGRLAALEEVVRELNRSSPK